MNTAFEHPRYTIRRKVLQIFGAGFHVFDEGNRVIAFSRQKAFKLKEDIRVFTDESMATELLRIGARQVIDFSAAYDVIDSGADRKIGAAQRRGLRSVLRDSWQLLDADDQVVARIEEDSAGLAFLRRFLTNLIPQTFHVRDHQGREQATLKVHFNPFVYRMTVDVASGCTLDRRLVFAAAVLVAAIEGRQQ